MIGRIRSAVAWLSERLAMARGVVIDPQLRGTVTPRVLEGLRARGLHVHRIGAAAYVHDPEHELRIITAVVEHRAAPPPWAGELDDSHRYLRGRGPATRRQANALDARARDWSRSRIRDQRGRFLARPAWWQGLDRQPLPGFLRPARAW